MSLKNHVGLPLALCLVASAVQLGAQSPATCTTAPTAVSSLSIESVLSLSNVMSTLTPTIPANVLAAITSGAQEVRSRFIYNPTGGTITNTTFLVAPGSPNPTPIGINVDPTTLISFTLQIDRVYTSCRPVPSVLFVGTVGSGAGSLGNLTGATGNVTAFATSSPPALMARLHSRPR